MDLVLKSMWVALQHKEGFATDKATGSNTLFLRGGKYFSDDRAAVRNTALLPEAASVRLDSCCTFARYDPALLNQGLLIYRRWLAQTGNSGYNLHSRPSDRYC